MIIPFDRKQEIDEFLTPLGIEQESIMVLSKDNKYYVKGNYKEVDDLTTYLMIQYPGFSGFHFEYQYGYCSFRIRTNGKYVTIAQNISLPCSTIIINNKTLDVGFLKQYLDILERYEIHDGISEIVSPYLDKYRVRVATNGSHCLMRFICHDKKDCSKSDFLSINQQLFYSLQVNSDSNFNIDWPGKAELPQYIQDNLSLYESCMSKMKEHFGDEPFINIPTQCRLNFKYNKEKLIDVSVDIDLRVYYFILHEFIAYIIDNFDSFSDPVFKPFLDYILTPYLVESTVDVRTADDLVLYLQLIDMAKI